MTDPYQDVPYPSRAWSQSHPAHVAALGTIAALAPPPVERWRILELGCGDAANLLPMAVDLPEASFVGVDRAREALDRGSRRACRLALRNLELCCADLVDWRPSGEFDYIIAHGIYSWVPPAVRENILEICRAHLTPRGIAYICYNALPGCHFRRYAWDLERFHARQQREPAARIEAARWVAKLAIDHPGEEPLHSAIRLELQNVLDRDPAVVFHDDLSDCNDPFYLFEFVEQAARHGLQYLGDAEPQRDSVRDLPFHSGDWLADRQYGDFLCARRFRKSLLCRAGIPLDRTLRLDRFLGLFAASRAIANPPDAEGEQRFELAHGRSLTTNHPLPRALLCRLGSLWPDSVQVSQLPLSSSEPDQAAGLLMRLVEAEAVELRTLPPHIAAGVSQCPATNPLVRLEIAEGLHLVTNQRHQTIELSDETGRKLVALLDGRHDQTALAQSLTGLNGDSGIDAVLRSSLLGLHRLCLLRE